MNGALRFGVCGTISLASDIKIQFEEIVMSYGPAKKKKVANSASPFERVKEATKLVANEPARRSMRSNIMRSCSDIPQKGVKVVQIGGIRHSAFIVNVEGVDCLFDTNDSKHGLAKDGFHDPPYSDMYRPFCERANQLDQRGLGQCMNVSNAISTWWYNHEDVDPFERLEQAKKKVVAAKNAEDCVRLFMQ